MKKTIQTLTFTLALALGPSTWAATTITAVWQEVYASTYAANGTSLAVDGGQSSETGDLFSSLSVGSWALNNLSGPELYTDALANASQYGNAAGLGFQFSGMAQTGVSGIYPGAEATAFHYIDFLITEQVETVKLELTAFSASTFTGTTLIGTNLPNFYAEVSYVPGGGVHSYGTYTGPGIYELPLFPGSYRLKAGVQVLETFSFSTFSRFASFSDTISFTNTVPEPSAALLALSGALGAFCFRRPRSRHDSRHSPCAE